MKRPHLPRGPSEWANSDDASKWLLFSLDALARKVDAHLAFPGAPISLVEDPIGELIRFHKKELADYQRDWFDDAVSMAPTRLQRPSQLEEHLIIRWVARIAGELGIFSFAEGIYKQMFTPPYWGDPSPLARETSMTTWNVLAGMLPSRAALGLIREAFSHTTLPPDLAQLLYFAQLKVGHQDFPTLTVRLMDKTALESRNLFLGKRFLFTLIAAMGVQGLATYLPCLPYGPVTKNLAPSQKCFGWLISSLTKGREAPLHIRLHNYQWILSQCDKHGSTEAEIQASEISGSFSDWLYIFRSYNAASICSEVGESETFHEAFALLFDTLVPDGREEAGR